MSKSLVIIYNQTRAHELTFSNFKKNVIDELGADLCVCIGVSPDYDYTNPFYQLAKYKFTFNEPAGDFAELFDDAYNQIISSNKLPEGHLHWREFLKIPFFGWGVDGTTVKDPASSGIQIFVRWFLLKSLIDNDILTKYDRFIVSRSDFMHNLPHPKVQMMNPDHIWIPDCEHYGGYTDRHAVLSKKNIVSYLNIFNNMILNSQEFYKKMYEVMNNKYASFIGHCNLETLLCLNIHFNNESVKFFPYVFFTVRNIDGPTRFSKGAFNESLGFFIKYHTEYNIYKWHENNFITSGLSIDDWYSKNICGEKCSRIECSFKRHTDISNNGGTHCCYLCKTAVTHGGFCQQVVYE